MRRNIHNMQKRRRVIVLLLFMIMSLTMKAQVFMMDGPENYGLAVDWYTPVGDGIIVLSVLGGAYLLRKRKENK